MRLIEAVLFKALLFNHLQKTRERQQGEQHQKTYFVWQEQIHSTYSHPEVWTHPLQLLFDVVNLKDVDTSHSAQCKKSCVTKLPESLPLTCHASHHHTWRSAQVHVGTDQILLILFFLIDV